MKIRIMNSWQNIFTFYIEVMYVKPSIKGVQVIYILYNVLWVYFGLFLFDPPSNFIPFQASLDLFDLKRFMVLPLKWVSLIEQCLILGIISMSKIIVESLSSSVDRPHSPHPQLLYVRRLSNVLRWLSSSCCCAALAGRVPEFSRTPATLPF